ncbi:MAG: DUF1552 domain-containing protein [Lacipirellulaceae bacterium]
MAGPENEKMIPQSKTPRLNRRQCLAAVGASLSLPCLESLGTASKVFAAKGATLGPAIAAPRLVCMGVSLSMYPGEWNPKETGRNYNAPRLIKPLEELRNDFTLISNADHPGVNGGHKGTPAFLSGVYQPERVGQSVIIRNQITIDQVVAKSVGSDTRFQSLQFGAAEAGPADAMSWNDKGIALQAMADPLDIFRKLFVNDPHPKKTARSMQAGRSILDLVNEDAKLLSGKLSNSDRQQMDQYMTSVRDVEQGIGRQLEWLNTPKPRVPKLTERATSYHENLDLVLDLTALALQTDSTRVVTVNIPGGGMPIRANGRRIGNYHGQSHHGKDPKVVEELIAIETLHTKSLARFLKKLKSIPAGDGTLLDETQVLFGSGLGNGSSHSNRDLPVLLAGGGLKHGQHIRLQEGTPLTNLFVTMLQQSGLEIESFAGSNGNVNEFLKS